jgi:WD40 repeat protein
LDQRAAASQQQADRAIERSERAATDCGPITQLQGHSDRLYSIAFAPDSQQLVTASLDKTARLWTRMGAPIAILEGHQDRIYRAEFSPDGDWILTGSRDRSIRIWKRPRHAGARVETLSTFLPLEADAGGVANAVFSPDGHYVVGAYWENAAILWRLWAEETDLPGQKRADWGDDRSHLALVQEAYRFILDNAVTEPTSERGSQSHSR